MPTEQEDRRPELGPGPSRLPDGMQVVQPGGALEVPTTSSTSSGTSHRRASTSYQGTQYNKTATAMSRGHQTGMTMPPNSKLPKSVVVQSPFATPLPLHRK